MRLAAASESLWESGEEGEECIKHGVDQAFTFSTSRSTRGRLIRNKVQLGGSCPVDVARTRIQLLHSLEAMDDWHFTRMLET